MRTLSTILVIGLAACGGKAKGPTGNTTGGGADQLPWEATLTTGATFELQPDADDPDAGGPLVVKVTAVEQDGAARVYRLQWGDGEGPGPSSIRVEGGVVTVGDAKPADMQKPWPQQAGDAICYAEDLSNPDGCDDICDASLCLSPTAGIVAVDGLYAPGYMPYAQR